jgi:hypothetical protein
MLYWVNVDKAGEVETRARQRLCRFSVARSYWKDGYRQDAYELLNCSFKEAFNSVSDCLTEGGVHDFYIPRVSDRYNVEP